MSSSNSALHALLHEVYTSGGSLAGHAKLLVWSARSMLEKSTIGRELERAKVIHGLLKSYQFGPVPSSDAFRQYHQLASLASELFDPIVDDVLLISAFEMYAKSVLLRKQYVVHEVKAPASAAKRQQSVPLHVRTVRASLASAVPITLRETTIGPSILLKPQYIKHFPMPKSATIGLAAIRDRRNLVHFHVGYSWQLTSDLIALVEHLQEALPRHAEFRRRRSP